MSFNDSYEAEGGVVPIWRPIELRILSQSFGLTPEWWVGVLEAQNVAVTEAMVNDWMDAKTPIPEAACYSLASVMSMTSKAIRQIQITAIGYYQEDETLLLSLPETVEDFWNETPDYQGLPLAWLEGIMAALIATLPPNAVRILPQNSLKN